MDDSQLQTAIENFNKASVAEAEGLLGIKYRMRGPAIYQAGHIRIAGLFTGPDGRHWGDAAIVAESVISYPDVTRGMADYWKDQPSQAREADDLWIFTDTRGKWNAIIAPVVEIARIFELPDPLRMPAGNWARTWWDMPERTDLQELAWIAAGGTPLAEYRQGGRW